MTDATKKPAAKKKDAAPAKDSKETKASKEAPAKKAAPKKTDADAKAIEEKEAGKGVKGKGTSTKGPTKSAPGSKEEPKAKPDQQPPSAFSKALQPSKELAAVIGASDPLPRTAVVSKVWEYIKKHKLQNAENRKEILADEKLKVIFEKDKVTMFEMNKYLNAHLKG